MQSHGLGLHYERRSREKTIADLTKGVFERVTGFKINKSQFRGLLSQSWPNIVWGTISGALFAFLFPSLVSLANAVFPSLSTTLLDRTVWPSHGYLLLLIVLFGVLLLILPRSISLLKRLWGSWHAGLPTGLFWLWLFSSGVAFSALGTSAAGYSLVFGLLAVLATALVVLLGASGSEPVDSRGISTAADTDIPIEAWHQDILYRRNVVDSLTQRITEDRASVVALVGPFGDGKTSVLNLLEETLRSHSHVLVVRFSSWLPGNEQVLVATLFNSIVQALERRFIFPEIRTSFMRYARVLTSLMPRVGGTVKEFFEEPSPSDQMRRLRQMIERLPVRVVLLVDDVDRMHRAELDVLLKLIRGASEFSNLTYVCAFHKPSLLNEYSKSTDENFAREYLERFFPVEIPLPKIDASILSEEFDKRFEKLCAKHGLLTTAEERKQFDDEFRPLWQVHVQKNIANLRRLKLLFNRIEACIGPIAKEVNLLDFLLLELVRENAPEIYEQIYKNGRYFYYPRWEFETWGEMVVDDQRERDERKKFFDSLFKGLEDDRKNLVLAFLERPFPVIKEWREGGGLPIGKPSESRSQRERRLHHPGFFIRYFALRVPSTQFGEAEFSQFVSKISQEKAVEDCVASFKDTFTAMGKTPLKRWHFFDRLAGSIDDFGEAQAEGLAIGVAEVSAELERPMLGITEGSKAAAIIFSVAKRFAESQKVQRFFEKVVSCASSDAFAAEILWYCVNREKQQILVHWENVDPNKLRSCFHKRMKQKYHPGGPVSAFDSDKQEVLPAFFEWVRCGEEGKTEVREYLSDEFARKPKTLGRFIHWMLPSDQFGGPDALASLEKLFPLKELKRLLDASGDGSFSTDAEQQAIERFRKRTAP